MDRWVEECRRNHRLELKGTEEEEEHLRKSSGLLATMTGGGGYYDLRN